MHILKAVFDGEGMMERIVKDETTNPNNSIEQGLLRVMAAKHIASNINELANAVSNKQSNTTQGRKCLETYCL